MELLDTKMHQQITQWPITENTDVFNKSYKRLIPKED